MANTACNANANAASSLGDGFTRFHVCVLFVWQFVNFFSAQMLFGIFSNFTPRWRCHSPSANSSIMLQMDEEMIEQMSSSALFLKDCSAYAKCHPELLEFEPIPFGSAAVEFEWICGTGTYMRAIYSQVQFGGILLGTIFIAPLSDRFGRKPIGLSAFALAILALAASAMARNAPQLLLARFMLCFLIGGAKVVLAAFTMEIIPPDCRIYLRTFCNWGISRLLLTSLCFLFPDWRSASVAISLVSVPALLILAFVIPESPTWLHSRGQMERKGESERRMAKIGGIQYEPVEKRQQEMTNGKRPNLLTIVRDPDLFGRLLVLWTMWFCSSLSSYSIDLNSSALSGNIFFNQWLLSCPIIASKMLLLLLDSSCPGFSRRILHQGSQLVVCVCFCMLSVMFFAKYDGILIMIGYFVGITFLEYTWDANYLSAVESMPTQLRASSLGSCSMVARIGGFFSPVFVFLNDIWGASAYLAVVSLGTTNLIVSYMWLPETKGIDLDEVLQQQQQDEGDQDEEKNGGNCGTKNNEEEGKMLK